MYNRFVATQSVELAVPEQSIPIEHYLRQPQRIVEALGDASQIEQLSQDSYRLRMRPLNFFMLKIEPTVDMKIWADEDGTVHLKSVACELRGIETINEHFQLNLSGTMQPTHIGGATYLRGGAELGLKIYLPPPFSMMPKSMVQSTGNGLLGSVLLKMKQKLMQQLLVDYSQWARHKAKEPVAA